MKALILAAGYATRMYPLTENQPKPLLKVGKSSIIEHQLKRLKELPEVEEIFIVTNARFYDQFRIWLNNFTYPKKITLINDGTLSKDDRLGAVGDINFSLKEAEINGDMLVLAGDNLFEDDLKDFLKFFQCL
jgi:glucose-1-phosphate thymidylyltransferase